MDVKSKSARPIMSAYALNLFPLPRVPTSDPKPNSNTDMCNLGICRKDSSTSPELKTGNSTEANIKRHVCSSLQNITQIKIINSNIEARAFFNNRKKSKSGMRNKQDTIYFDLLVTENSRRYTIRRSLCKVVKLHSILSEEQGDGIIPDLPEGTYNLEDKTDYKSVRSSKRHRIGYSMLQASIRYFSPIIEKWLSNVCLTCNKSPGLKDFLREDLKTKFEMDDGRLSVISEDEEEEEDNEYDLYYGENGYTSPDELSSPPVLWQ